MSWEALNENFDTELPTTGCGLETFQADGVRLNVGGKKEERSLEANAKDIRFYCVIKESYM